MTTRAWQLIWELILGLPVSVPAAIATRTNLGWAIVGDALELVVLARIIGPIGWRQAFWLEVVEEELVKLREAAQQHYEDEEASDRAQARAVRDEHRITPYLFGRFNVWDAYLLGRGAYVVTNAGIPQAVFAAVRDAISFEDVEIIGFL